MINKMHPKGETEMLREIREQTVRAVQELCELAGLEEGDLLVIGCSSSEVAGKRIGTFSHPEIASAVWDGAYPFLRTRKMRRRRPVL